MADKVISKPETPLCIAQLLEEPIVVLTPHPDDNAFGCGALLTHAFANKGAHIICMGEGPHAGAFGGPCARRGEIELAVAYLGGQPGDITALRRPAGWAEQPDTFRMLARHVGTIAQAMGARRIFSTADTSENAEHRATAEVAAMAAEMFDLSLCHYQVWAEWTEAALEGASPGGTLHRLPVGDAVAAKSRALGAFRSRFGQDLPSGPSGITLPADYTARFLGADELFYEAARASRPGKVSDDRKA
ncbi:LmbE family protein [Roseivivax halodurans JCM 10272]|uniref:LmbE family protein n=1 Tax=Roseivivax halodurans JCM 10272 TaxID=1449350 RepID=X7EES3_9RHOB|nr:PIG-L family deacetylase [Roseivivax halodurans]ETX14360.1 LmbE family protein [Roseivivax halodurans JCM 10272]